MTKNQIEYQKLLETQRANRAQESITQQRDARTLDLRTSELGETRRHNVAGEQAKFVELGETHRTNVAKETETERANRTRETETHRTNLAQEAERERSARAHEQETMRHNVETERQGAIGLNLRSGELQESIRSHKATEGLRGAELTESTRSHMATEAIRTSELSEQERTNRAREAETQRHNVVGESQESSRINLAGQQTEADLIRAQAATSQAETAARRQTADAVIGGVNAGVNVIKTIPDVIDIFGK